MSCFQSGYVNLWAFAKVKQGSKVRLVESSNITSQQYFDICFNHKDNKCTMVLAYKDKISSADSQSKIKTVQ